MWKIFRINKDLLSYNLERNIRPLSPDDFPDPADDTSTPFDMRSFVKSVIKQKNMPILESHLKKNLSALGLDSEGRPTNSSKKEDFIEGLRTLVDFHFRNYDENEHADILGELFYNGKIFSKEASKPRARLQDP